MNQFCIVIPNYNYVHAIATVILELNALKLPIIMVMMGVAMMQSKCLRLYSNNMTI